MFLKWILNPSWGPIIGGGGDGFHTFFVILIVLGCLHSFITNCRSIVLLKKNLRQYPYAINVKPHGA